MKRFFERLKDFLFFSLAGLYRDFDGGLIALTTIFAIRHEPFRRRGFTALFELFRLTGLQKL